MVPFGVEYGKIAVVDGDGIEAKADEVEVRIENQSFRLTWRLGLMIGAGVVIVLVVCIIVAILLVVVLSHPTSVISVSTPTTPSSAVKGEMMNVSPMLYSSAALASLKSMHMVTDGTLHNPLFIGDVVYLQVNTPIFPSSHANLQALFSPVELVDVASLPTLNNYPHLFNHTITTPFNIINTTVAQFQLLTLHPGEWNMVVNDIASGVIHINQSLYCIILPRNVGVYTSFMTHSSDVLSDQLQHAVSPFCANGIE